MKSHVLLLACILPATQNIPAGVTWHTASSGQLTHVSDGTQTLTLPKGASGAVDIMPAEPVQLSPETTRIRIWVSGGSGIQTLNFGIQDADGARHTLSAARGSRNAFNDWTRDGKVIRPSQWTLFESDHLLETPEIESRVLPEFLPVLETTRRPRPWTLEKITLNLRGQTEQETLIAFTAPAQILVDGLSAEYNWLMNDRLRWGWDVPPVLFPDDFRGVPGDYMLGLEVRAGYQGPLVFEVFDPITIPENDPAQLYAQRIELPSLPKGRYFIESRLYTRAGVLLDRETQLLTVARGSGQADPLPNPLFLWQTDTDHAVFPEDTESAEIRFHVSARLRERHGPRVPEWRFTVRDWLQRSVPLEVGISEKAEGGQVYILSVHDLQPGTDYMLVAEAIFNDRPREFQQFHFGVKSPAEGDVTSKTVPPGVLNVQELLEGHRPVLVGDWTMHQPEKYQGSPLQQPDRFDLFMKDIREKGFTHSSNELQWGDIEPLPGVFRWEGVDHWLEKAEEMDLPMFLMVAINKSYYRMPLWLAIEPQLDQFGYISEGRLRPGIEFMRPSEFDLEYKDAERTLLTRLFTRDLEHPAFAGVRLRTTDYGDNIRPEPTQRDYGDLAQSAFAGWLRERGREPEPLPTRRQVPGEPRFGEALGPDLSEAWQTFHAFRTDTYLRSVEEILKTIRAIDPIRPIGLYRGPRPGAFEKSLPLLARHGAFFHDEGGPGYLGSTMGSLTRTQGVSYTYESHRYVPPSRRMMDASVFYGGLYGKGMNYLLRYDTRFYNELRLQDMQGALEHLRDSRPAINEWAAGTPVDSGILVLGSRYTMLLSGPYRLGFYSHIAGRELFDELFTQLQYPAAFATDAIPGLDLSPYKVVIVAGDVLPDHVGRKLEAYAANGGHVALYQNAGAYSPEQPDRRNVLADRLSTYPGVHRFAHLDEALCQWMAEAGVTRRIETLNEGFQVYLKRMQEDELLAAVFRPYRTQYGELWFDSQETSDRFFNRMAELGSPVQPRPGGGTLPFTEDIGAPRVRVNGLRPGQRYRLKQIHRQERELGELTADEGGSLVFELDPVNIGFLQLVRITPLAVAE